MRGRFLALLMILTLMPAARADVLHVAGAGSLASAFTDLLLFRRARIRSQRQNLGHPA
jgi:hypothetical protein